MTKADRIWSGKLAGVPQAVLLGVGIAFDRLRDRLATRLWRTNLCTMERGSVIQAGVTIRHPGYVSIGRRVSIGTNTVISSEFPGSTCTIRECVIINPKVHIDFTGGIEIGENTVISEEVHISTHSHGYDPKSRAVRKPIKIGRNVWVGLRVLILEGVDEIADGAIIAGGAVVTRSITEPGIYAGIPAVKIKTIPT